MAYQFSFDGKSLWALGASSLLLCLLIFFAGILLGANWETREATATTATASPGAARKQAQPPPGAQEAEAPAAADAALPYEPPPAAGPAFYERPAPQDYSARGYDPRGAVAQGYGAQDYRAQDYGARPYTEQGYQARPAAPPAYGAQQRYASPFTATREAAPAAPPDSAREAARLNALGTDAEPRVVSEADTGGADAPYADSPNYSVQVGAFTDEGEARRLLAELEHKGYTPAIFSGRAGEGRIWYTVRIGAYSTQQEAAHAAQNFTKQERLKTTVRPANSL